VGAPVRPVRLAAGLVEVLIRVARKLCDMVRRSRISSDPPTESRLKRLEVWRLLQLVIHLRL
jgi:hypothetical protein